MNETKRSDTEQGKQFTSDELLEKLRRALQKDGDFPASAKIVNELKMLTSDPKTTANQITEVILREPSLGVRVLNLVNSSFYKRGKSIMTVSQAVIQIGMKPLAELCANLVLLQKFVPAAREGGLFANCLRHTVLTSLLSSSFGENTRPSSDSRNSESGFLAGSFSELGTLLLAYYFPPIYANAVKRAETKKQDVQKSITEITGLTTVQLSAEVLKALGMPAFYLDVLGTIEKMPVHIDPKLPKETQEIIRIARGVSAAQTISTALASGNNKDELDQAIARLRDGLGLDVKVINQVVSNLPTAFKDHCSSIELNLPPLPTFIATYSADEGTGQGGASGAVVEEKDEFSRFVDEIREVVESKEPTSSVITTVMETLAWNMHFDRVMLLLAAPGKKKLMGRMMLGKVENFDPTKMFRPLGSEAEEFAPDNTAFKEGRPIFTGDPLFEDGWPIAVLPIGFGPRAVGVIYADRVSQDDVELNGREQAAIGLLAELLDRSLTLQSR